MAPSEGRLSRELSAELLKITDVCLRIENWTSRFAVEDSPLLELAKARIGLLIAAVRYLSTQITDPDVDLQTASIETLRLEVVRELLSESLSLLELCTDPNIDLNGDDGAINAVYASMYLLGGSAERNEALFMKIRRLHISSQVWRAFFECFGPQGTSRNYQWGLPSSPPPLPGTASEPWQRLGSLVAAFHPRYVHSYSASDEPPYVADKSTVAASGSFGTVRKVIHKSTGRVFAAKSFHNVLSKRDRRKILRELGCLELCAHHNLITLVEAYELKDDPHTITIVMEPWAPHTLWNFLLATDARRKIEFPWFEPNRMSSSRYIYQIMLDIVAAVGFLHKRSIKHKDIKPQNILLCIEATGAVRPIVTDVGETKIYRAGTATDPMKSSYEYLAPEQLLEQGDMQSSLKADIWQLGCCFAMLLAVAISGLSGLEKLWNSFTNTAEKASCNIANESVNFMRTLRDICLPGSLPQEHVHWMVTRMLDTDPTTRPEIEKVMADVAVATDIDDDVD